MILLIILLVMGFLVLVVDCVTNAEIKAQQRKRLGPDFDEQTVRYQNLIKDQIDRHF